MRTLCLLSLLSLVACDGFTFPDPESGPVIDSMEWDCNAGYVSGRIVATDLNSVTNVEVDVSGVHGTESWLPEQVVDNTETVTVWELTEPLSCDLDWTFTVTATNMFGQQGEAVVTWPEPVASLAELDPPWGTDAGGSAITLIGEGLEAVTQVLFGTEQATIETAADTTLELSSPAGSPGTVDVTVTAEGEDLVLDSAFTYYPDASGLVGGISLPLLLIYDPSIYSIGSVYGSIAYGSFAQLEVIFHEPIEAETTFLGAQPEPGSCEWGAYSWSPYDLGTYLLTEEADLGGFAMLPSDGLTYYLLEDEIPVADWTDTWWDVEILNEHTSLPAMVLEDLVYIPPELDGPSFDYKVVNEHVQGEDLTLSWTNGSDYDTLSWLVYPATGTTPLTTLSCASDPGEGELFLAWSDLTEGIDEAAVTGLFIALTFSADVETTLPHDSSTFWNRGLLQYWVYVAVN